jgi:hypothetical protein
VLVLSTLHASLCQQWLLPHYLTNRGIQMSNKLEQEEYLYRRAIDIIESADTDQEKEDLLFQEVWIPLAELYKDRIIGPGAD